MNANPTGRIETANLILTDSNMDDIPELKRVYASWTDKEAIEGSGFEEGYFERCITEGDLPPLEGASKEDFRQKSIRLRQGNTLIGFIDLYFGFPTPDTVWISNLVIDSAYRNRGFAQETIETVALKAGTHGFTGLGIGVFLNNWRALRFWTRAGFDKVTGIHGDKDYGEGKYALIGLRRQL